MMNANSTPGGGAGLEARMDAVIDALPAFAAEARAVYTPADEVPLPRVTLALWAASRLLHSLGDRLAIRKGAVRRQASEPVARNRAYSTFQRPKPRR